MQNLRGQFSAFENFGWLEMNKNSGETARWLTALFLIILLAGVILIFVEVDIGISAPGIIRPVDERTEIRSLISGMVDSIYCKEGDFIKKGTIVLTLNDRALRNKMNLTSQQVERCKILINDLEILTSKKDWEDKSSSCLQSSIYKEQAMWFIRRKEVEFTVLKKAKKTLQLNQYLADNKVISSKEFFDIKTEAEKASAAYESLITEQRSEWQSDLLKYKQELSNYQAETKELDSESFLYAIRAPVSGSIQGINTRYSGSAILTNEPICIISPECRLMAECYVSPRDIAFLRINESARFQIHAFDFNYFGSFTGKITSVDNDYSLIDNKPVFRVRCSFDEEQNLIRKSNFIKLKKGLTLQGRFLMNRRPVWRLIFEKMNDWINPSSPPEA